SAASLPSQTAARPRRTRPDLVGRALLIIRGVDNYTLYMFTYTIYRYDIHQPKRRTGRHMNENRTALRRNALSEPLTLRSGITLPNRLATAATSEHPADRPVAPTNRLITAYRGLALSGAGLLISGNVMVDGAALEAPRNVVIEDDRHREQLRRWAAVTEGTDAKFVLQLSHPGRQTMRGNVLRGGAQDVVGPSEVPLAVGGNRLFRGPRALSEAEITEIIGRFARAARIAANAGFHGVEIHA